jgi:hypothetical protein
MWIEIGDMLAKDGPIGSQNMEVNFPSVRDERNVVSWIQVDK